jgi:hypothetical protein
MPSGSPTKEVVKGLLGPEVGRALLFAKDSLSPETITRLQDAWLNAGLSLEELNELAAEGVEEIEESEGSNE